MDKKILIFFLTLLFSFSIQAKNHLPPKIKRCQPQIKKYLKNWQSQSEWRTLLSTDKNIKRFATPTKSFGTWIYLEDSKNTNSIKLAKHSQTQMVLVHFNSNCTPRQSHSQSKAKSKYYTDKNLVKLIRKNKEMLLLLWSPDMSYTSTTLTQLQKLSKTEKIPVYGFLDKGAPKEAALILKKKHKLPASYMKKLDSFELRMRGARSHLPVVFYIKNQQIKGPEMAGYKSSEEYQDLLRKRKSL